MVGTEGLEPSRCYHQRILSPLRLPIPPRPQLTLIVYKKTEWDASLFFIKIYFVFDF